MSDSGKTRSDGERRRASSRKFPVLAGSPLRDPQVGSRAHGGVRSSALLGDEATMRERISALEARLDDARAQHARIKADRTAEADLMGKILARVSEADARRLETEERLAAAEVRARAAEEAAGTLRAELASARTQANAAAREIERLRGEKAQARASTRPPAREAALQASYERRIDQLTDSLAEMHERLDAMREALEASEKERTRLAATLEARPTVKTATPPQALAAVNIASLAGVLDTLDEADRAMASLLEHRARLIDEAREALREAQPSGRRED